MPSRHQKMDGEVYMGQKESPGEAVNAYFSYVLADGPDKDVWKARLVARGEPYPEKWPTKTNSLKDGETNLRGWQVNHRKLKK